MKYYEIQAEDELFSTEDIADCFYFIMEGTIHTLGVDHSGEEKISSIHNSNEIFGYKNETDFTSRNKRGVATKQWQILKIDTAEYQNIKRNRVLTQAEHKINYLTQFIPGLRKVDAKIIQEIETFFVKERLTKGYRVICQGKSNEDLHFIVSGECRILYNSNLNPKLKAKFDSLDESVPSFIKLGKLKCGDSIGETSALKDTDCNYSVQVESPTAEIYKIRCSKYFQIFGGEKGTPVKKLRAKSVMDVNWFKTVLKRLTKLPIDRLMSMWEFVEKSHDPTSTCKREDEVPYLKNIQSGSVAEMK